MSLTRTNILGVLNSTMTVIHGLAIPVLPVVAAAIAKYNGIEDVRQLAPSELKDQIKQDFCKLSGLINVFGMAESFFPSLSVLFKAWPNLEPKQRALVAFTTLFALGSSAYPLSELSVEQHTMAAGAVSSLSSFSFRFSQAMATKFATHNAAVGEETRLLGVEDRANNKRAFS